MKNGLVSVTMDTVYTRIEKRTGWICDRAELAPKIELYLCTVKKKNHQVQQIPKNV